MSQTQALIAYALLGLIIANLFWGKNAATNRGAVSAAFTGPKAGVESI